jgi:hypothetical protein
VPVWGKPILKGMLIWSDSSFGKPDLVFFFRESFKDKVIESKMLRTMWRRFSTFQREVKRGD